jgi:hypothetical protein
MDNPWYGEVIHIWEYNDSVHTSYPANEFTYLIGWLGSHTSAKEYNIIKLHDSIVYNIIG